MNTIEVFCCYAHEDRELLLKLKKQLAPFLRYQLISMDFWYDARILPGTEWGSEIFRHLNNAHIILLLVSPDFMDSDHCYGIEMTRAMERHERGEAHVIPVILRPVHWQKAPFGALQALPQDGQPVTSWPDLDEALFDVVEGINKVIESIVPKPLSESPSAAPDTAKALALVTRSWLPALVSTSWEWDKYTASQTIVLHHSEPIASIALSPDETVIASDGWDNTLLYWKIPSDRSGLQAQREQTSARLSQPLYTVSFRPNDSLLRRNLVASGGADAIVRIWDDTSREVKTLRGHSGPVSCVAFSPDGDLLASASDDHTIKIWNTETGREVTTLREHTGPVSCVAFSPNGDLLASASYDTSVNVWYLSQAQKVYLLHSTFTHHQDTVHCVAFSPDGDLLASGDHRGNILIYNPNSGTSNSNDRSTVDIDSYQEQVLQQPGPVYSIVFHGPSRALISGGYDGNVRVWELSTGQLLKTFSEHKKAVTCLAVSPWGSVIASGSLDKTIQVRQKEVRMAHTGDNLDYVIHSDVGFPPVHPMPYPYSLLTRPIGIAWLRRAISEHQLRSQNQLERWLYEGMKHSFTMQYEKALKDYEQAFRCDPEAHKLLCENRYLMEQEPVLQRILSYCETAIGNNQQGIFAHLIKSYTLLFLRMPPEALIACEQAVTLDSHNDHLFFLRDQIRWSLRRSQFHRHKIICRYLLLSAACGIVLMGIGSGISPGFHFPNPIFWISALVVLISLLVSWIWSLINAVRLRRWGWFIFLGSLLWLAVCVYVFAGPETPFLKTKEK